MKRQVSIINSIIICGLMAGLISILSLFSQSIRLDEAQSIWTSSKSVPFLLELTAEDVNLPLYGLILHFWMQILGTETTTTRLLSLVFFLATLPVIYLISKEMSNKRGAIMSVVLFSFSPFMIWYSSEARTYTLFVLVTSFSHLFFLRMLRSQAKTGKLGYLLSTILGLYTHYFFIFLIISQTVYNIIRYNFSRKKKSKTIVKGMRSFLWDHLGLVISSGLLFLPWLTYVLEQGGAANTQPSIPPPNSYNIVVTFINFIFGFQSQQIQNVLVSLWPITIVFLFIMFTQKKGIRIKHINYFLISTFLPIILVYLISLIRPIFLSRYLIIITPGLFILLSWLLVNQKKKISLYLPVMFVVGMMALMFFQNTSLATPVKEDYSGVVAYLNSETKRDDIVTASAPFTIYPIEYQYQGLAKLTTIPIWDRYTRGAIPNYSSEELVKQIEEYKKIYQRLFVVLSYDQGYENEIVTYLDHNLERLDNQNFSNSINIRIYKLRY